LFHLQPEDEPEPVPLEVEYIEVKAITWRQFDWLMSGLEIE
jgi:hypothetical protein